jgi:2-deoxy-D-gluconate 3-dehydrogenase
MVPGTFLPAPAAAEPYATRGMSEPKRTIITGASRGIGAATARVLARRGDRLALVQRGDAAVASEIGALQFRCDLADAEAADRIVDEAAEALGGLDVLVANAGTIIRKPTLEMTLEEFRHVIDVNLIAQWSLARAAARRFVAQGGGGAIVLTASLLSFQGGLNISSYTAAKHGVAGLAKSFANEWAAHGIRVNCVAPGYIANEQTRPLREDPVREPAITSRIPQGRWGTDEEVAEAIAWLSSDAASYVNGTALTVDGGWMGR